MSTTFENDIEAVATLGGDLTNAGQVSGPITFRTEVEVRGNMFGHDKSLGFFSTLVRVDSSASISLARSFSTLLGVYSRPTILIDGRRDLLYTGGYRR